MAKDIKEIVTAICELMYKEAPNMSIAVIVADENNVLSTVKVNNAMERDHPDHMDRMLVILTAMYYKRYVEPAMTPTTMIVDAKTGSGGTVQ